MYPALVEDTRRGSSRAALALLRRIGPGRMFKLAPKQHRRVYDVGQVQVVTDRGSVVISFAGAAVFGHPTWRMLQVMAQDALLELSQTDAHVVGVHAGADAFDVRVTW